VGVHLERVECHHGQQAGKRCARWKFYVWCGENVEEREKEKERKVACETVLLDFLQPPAAVSAMKVMQADVDDGVVTPRHQPVFAMKVMPGDVDDGVVSPPHQPGCDHWGEGGPLPLPQGAA
jgi:hypothetical protein